MNPRIPRPVNAALDWLGAYAAAPLRGTRQWLPLAAAFTAVAVAAALYGPLAGLFGLACVIAFVAGGWRPRQRESGLLVRCDELEREVGRLRHKTHTLVDRLETDQVHTERLYVIGYEDRAALRGGEGS